MDAQQTAERAAQWSGNEELTVDIGGGDYASLGVTAGEVRHLAKEYLKLVEQLGGLLEQ